jgi:CBS domain-containing protein
MKTVDRLLDGKGREVISIGPDATVYEALTVMGARNIGALLVQQEDVLSGILSERDYARKVVLQGKRSRETKVRDIMSTRVVGISGERTVEEAMAVMTEKRVRHLPVLADNRVTGIISIGDVVKAVIDEKEFHIQQLEMYITQGG